MKSTALFALIVALLGRQPPPPGPGPEDPAANQPPVQQPSAAVIPKPEEGTAGDGRVKSLAKGRQPARKD